MTGRPQGSTRTADVLVVGSGVAGAVAAQCLARSGHDVVVVAHGQEDDELPRSVPTAALPLFEDLGLDRSAFAAWAEPVVSSSVAWTPGRVERAPHPSILVDHGKLVRALVERATERGAELRASDRPPRVERVGASWRVSSEDCELEAPHLVVASAGTLRGRRVRCGEDTRALVAHWDGPRRAGAHVVVEATARGWAWMAVLPSGRRSLVWMHEPSEENVGEQWAELCASFRLLVGELPTSTPRLRVVDASSWLTESEAGQDLTRVGSASFTIDPLSSQGVIAAVTNARQAAAALSTALRDPSAAIHARAFLEARVSELAASHAAHAGRFYAEGALVFGSPFWTRRAVTEPVLAPTLRGGTAPRARLSLSPSAVVAAEPVLEGDRIVLRPTLRHPSLSRGIAFLGGAPIEDLLEAALRGSAPRASVDWLWSHGVVDLAADEHLPSDEGVP